MRTATIPKAGTMTSDAPATQSTEMAAITSNEQATHSLVYRALLHSIREGNVMPGAKIPNERDLAQQLGTSRTAVRATLSMMERQGLVDRRVGSGTFLPDEARAIFERMDQTSAGVHEAVPSFGGGCFSSWR